MKTVPKMMVFRNKATNWIHITNALNYTPATAFYLSCLPAHYNGSFPCMYFCIRMWITISMVHAINENLKPCTSYQNNYHHQMVETAPNGWSVNCGSCYKERHWTKIKFSMYRAVAAKYENINVTGSAKTRHVGTKYTLMLNESYLSTGIERFHFVTFLKKPDKL